MHHDQDEPILWTQRPERPGGGPSEGPPADGPTFAGVRLASRCATSLITALSSESQLSHSCEGLEVQPAPQRPGGVAMVSSTSTDMILATDVDDDRIAISIETRSRSRSGRGNRGRVEVEAMRREHGSDPMDPVVFEVASHVEAGLAGEEPQVARTRFEALPEDLGSTLLSIAVEWVLPTLCSMEIQARLARARNVEDGGRAVPDRGRRIALYALRDVERAMANDNGQPRPEAEEPAIARRRAIASMGEAAATRRLAGADAAMVARLAAIRGRAPHMAGYLDVLELALKASLNTGTPIACDPVLLVGSPGTGKTWLLRQVAGILGIPFRRNQMNGTSLSEYWSGSAPSWKGAGEGEVARCLLGEEVANPLFLVDEFDKASPHGFNADPYRAFYTLLERENARTFSDEYLNFPLDASHVLWVGTANETTPIPGPVLDRMRVLEVPDIEPSEMPAIIASIHDDALQRYEGWFTGRLPAPVVDSLSSCTPRQVRMALDRALTAAASQNRREIEVADLPKAGRQRHYGFMR